MNHREFLEEVIKIPGLPAYEHQVATYIADSFRPMVDDVHTDAHNNVFARVGKGGPKLLISAHLDEIGLVVSQIEKDGSIRMHRSGGVDPRILPASEVTIHAKNGATYGVVGAKPPHLLSTEDRKKAIQLKDLYVDVGMSAESVRERIKVGDQITLTGPLTELAGGHLAGKTMDDRAGVLTMLCAAEILNRMKVDAEVYFVSSCQEEVGCIGAGMAGYSINPDFAIAIDVMHGEMPGVDKWQVAPLNKVGLEQGPTLHPELLRRLEETAKKNHVDYVVRVTGGNTWTDADSLYVRRDGIPTALIEIPLRYMHTTVETLNESVIEEAGRLIALFIADISREWEGVTWF